ncbi:M24 family metallopeptidase, partial [Patescibacteria group bacterium]|nr:M24 family metallopeptidase [Patescibacteria group bacterium]
FVHGIGHGVGLEIHESPSLKSDEGKLRQGQVITIEPGLYYPNVGGIRIEDTLVVTKKGSKNLAKTTKKLLEL